MRFYLIDQIETWEAKRSIKARKITSSQEEYWDSIGSKLVMPEPLILEAFCQAGAWLIFISTASHQRAALLSIGSVEFQGSVQPSDVLELEVNLTAMGDEVAAISGRALVAQQTVMEVKEVLLALTEASQLEDPQETTRMQHLLTRRGA
ncbi:hypothetical protein I8751_28160 [Nostocaceae cyanobacterium CENA357]|uniref:3-hydroxylacyl-ACP dehydratase n=1 Tax=Atlanticothrix silvestris CENA357 TaxID=1725252 RepID=A0A8J7HNH2_9CYAN|nr:hypothetical protein [Atlanticothrix silvestris]MBH8556143.1 hypothetical protein [Atlanticothrix silvestris CENA357]